jgi:hypothetical protein
MQSKIILVQNKSLVDVWMLYDNSGEKPLLIDAGGKK